MAGSDILLERLTRLHPKKIDLSLGRTIDLLDKLGRPQDRLPPVIHVAGTNGKGSTVAFMRAMLEAAGKRVHVYTSPHLVRFHERIRLAGKLVDEDELARTLADCERINAGAPITLFEITTVAAFKLFSEHEADVLLLEVGLGGRFDTTNVVEHPLACVITPVSIDHVDFLGDTIAKIAFEKAGILKAGVPAVIADQVDDARAVIERRAAELRAPLIIGGQDFSAREERGRLVYEDGRGLLDLPLPALPGAHQIGNAGVAIATLRMAFPELPDAIYARGVVEVAWPARLQQLKRGALLARAPAGADLWLDGGHNAAGGVALAGAIAELAARSPRPLVMIVGMLTTKDSEAFLTPFRGLATEIVAVPVAGDHAGRAPGEIIDIASRLGLVAREAESVAAALDMLAARHWPSPPRVLIAGSLYLAGAVLAENETPPT